MVGLAQVIKQTESTLRGDEANLGYARIYAPIGCRTNATMAGWRKLSPRSGRPSAPLCRRRTQTGVNTVCLLKKRRGREKSKEWRAEAAPAQYMTYRRSPAVFYTEAG